MKKFDRNYFEEKANWLLDENPTPEYYRAALIQLLEDVAKDVSNECANSIKELKHEGYPMSFAESLSENKYNNALVEASDVCKNIVG